MKIRYIIIQIVFFSIIVISNSIIVLYSPFAFVRVVDLTLVIIASGIIGSLIREIFVIKNKNDS